MIGPIAAPRTPVARGLWLLAALIAVAQESALTSASASRQSASSQAASGQAASHQAKSSVNRSDDPIDLVIGDPVRKQQQVTVGVDQIVDTRTGATITPAEVAERLRDTRILLLGERHTSREDHRIQRRIIQELHRAGRAVIIGLEMFPYTQQASLDRWSRGDGAPGGTTAVTTPGAPAATTAGARGGKTAGATRGATGGTMSEEAFVRDAAWYEHWGYPWGYYRDIFLFARDRQLPMVAVNAPRDVVAAVRKKGFANLTPEEARHIPTGIDVDSAEHLTLFKAYFEAGDAVHAAGMTDAAWKSMLSAQATWDATMGLHAVRAWEAAKDPAAIVVVLVGAGHAAYGLGIERQVRRGFDGVVSTLIPVDVKDAPLSVRASYASFVWGVPAEAHPAYPALGLSTMAVPAKADAGAAGGGMSDGGAVAAGRAGPGGAAAPTTAVPGKASGGGTGGDGAAGNVGHEGIGAGGGAGGSVDVVAGGESLRQVIAVEKDSPAAAAGVAIGDVLLAFDGQPVATRAALDRLMAEKDWGDVGELKVRRGTAQLTLRIAFRR